MQGSFIKKIVIYYITFLAYIKLRFLFKGKLVALGGCFGKSSAIKILEAILKTEYKIYSSDKNGKGLNSESGIPFVILNISPSGYGFFDWLRYGVTSTVNLFKKFDPEVLLLEYGVDKPGDMKHLVTFFKPNIGILINSNNTHSANFEELQKTTERSFESLIAEENGFILKSASDAIIYNLEDPEVVAQVSRFNGEFLIPYSTSNNASVLEFTPTLQGTKIVYEYEHNRYLITFDHPLLEEYRSSFEMGIKLAEYFKIKPKSLEKALSSFELPAGRCHLFRGVKETNILDSSYNSSFVPASSALSLLRSIAPKRKIAVLGDMRELGVLSQKEHEKLAIVAAETTDLVITVGPMMLEYFKPVFEANKRSNQIIESFKTTKEALEYLSFNGYERLQQDDTILVKGSQNTLLLEIIVEKLLSNPDDVSKLCRRGDFYEKKRQELLA